MVRTGKRLTLEEFLRLPEQEPPLEYFKGRITPKPMPQGQHGRLQIKLGALIDAYAEPRQLALTFTELRSSYDDASRVPDIAVYRWDRVGLLPDGRVPNQFTTPPDLAIEILSPEQRLSDLRAKCRWYVTSGSDLVLLVNPENESVERFSADGAEATLRGADTIDFAPVLPGLTLTVDAVFALLRPAARAKPPG